MLGYYDSWLAFQQRYRRVPGVQAAVLVDGEVVMSTAYGVADVATGTPLTTDHLFHVASHSKTFTATVVHQLAAAGGCGSTTRWGSGCPTSRVRRSPPSRCGRCSPTAAVSSATVTTATSGRSTAPSPTPTP